MRDVRTNRIYFSKAAKDMLRVPFARAGHDIRQIQSVERAIAAWVDTLPDDVAHRFAMEIDRRANTHDTLDIPYR